MENGCETTTLDSFAYTWDASENCVMTKVLTQEAKKENQFLFLSEVNDTGKGTNKKLKVLPESYVENLRDPRKQTLKVFL